VRILILDSNHNDLKEFCKVIDTLPLEIIVDIAYNHDRAMDLYTQNKYELVFIDFLMQMEKKVIEQIVCFDPEQRIITFTNIHNCSDDMACSFCKNTYKKERLLKPISKDDIVSVLTNKKCIYENFDNIRILHLKKIEKCIKDSYPHFTFDTESLTFIDTKNKPYNRAFFVLIGELKEYKISYIVDENANIKVLI